MAWIALFCSEKIELIEKIMNLPILNSLLMDFSTSKARGRIYRLLRATLGKKNQDFIGPDVETFHFLFPT